ncbi:hypothetical protein ACFWP7_37340 [Streptomyces sp. NPDC058470]|uniref:hypothetical protein n=1 Tax=Streptomyces sp. NPDC058470 TaxID=3346515 RepID=UPI003669ED9F
MARAAPPSPGRCPTSDHLSPRAAAGIPLSSGNCPYSAASSAALPTYPQPIYGPEFSANRRATYDQLRVLGPIVPCEIAPGVYGYITTAYRSALYLLRNTPMLFAKDPIHWQALRDGEVPRTARLG